ncbi:MAG: acyl carrier protein [Oscillospiraceae bacterium]|nr:acyl carrier protein [Oscillospiraceae bacterium]
MALNLLREILADVFSTDAEEITPETDLYEDLYADSADLLELRFILEEEFGIRDADADALAQMATVGEIAAYLQAMEE